MTIPLLSRVVALDLFFVAGVAEALAEGQPASAEWEGSVGGVDAAGFLNFSFWLDMMQSGLRIPWTYRGSSPGFQFVNNFWQQ